VARELSIFVFRNLLTQTRPLINSTFKRKCPRNYTPCSPPPLECENSWCLGSQGSGSFQDSPRDSPISCTCSIEEWYSPTYKVPSNWYNYFLRYRCFYSFLAPLTSTVRSLSAGCYGNNELTELLWIITVQCAVTHEKMCKVKPTVFCTFQ
jgi:hypothetical protein